MTNVDRFKIESVILQAFLWLDIIVSLHQATHQNLISLPGQTALIWYVVFFWHLVVEIQDSICFTASIIAYWLKRMFLQSPNATWASLSRQQCVKFGGQLVGEACGFVPDITLMSFILFFGTYTCSMALKKFKTSRFFPTTVSDGIIYLLNATVWCSFSVLCSLCCLIRLLLLSATQNLSNF